MPFLKNSLCFFVFFFFAFTLPLPSQAVCPSGEIAIHGSSLSPLADNGQTFMASPPTCAAIERGDLILFKTTSHRQALVVKIASGIPGDSLGVEPDGTVTINGMPAIAPDGKPYVASKRGRYRIGLHAGTIPPGAYLALGNPGSLDSGRLGLIVASDIVGVVKMNRFP